MYLASKGIPSAVVFPKARARAILYAPESDRQAFRPHVVSNPVLRKLQPAALRVAIDINESIDHGFVSSPTQAAQSVIADSGSITDAVQIVDDYGVVEPTPPDLHDNWLISTATIVNHDHGSIADPITSFSDGGSIV